MGHYQAQGAYHVTGQGYRSDVVDLRTGRVVYQGAIMRSHYGAEGAARQWIDAQRVRQQTSPATQE